MRFLLLVCLMVGVAQAETPAQIAKRLIDAQVDALKIDDTEASTAALEKLFDRDGMLVGPDGEAGTPATSLVRMPPSILGGNTNKLRSAKVTSLVAGGDHEVVWISAELELEVYNQNSPKKPSSRSVRITEVAASKAGAWKIGAALFGVPGTPKRSKDPQLGVDIIDKPKLPTLGKFVTKPAQLAYQLPAKDDTVVVFGTEKTEKAVGAAAAKKLLESWKSLDLQLEGNVYEVDGGTYGFVIANVNWVKPGGAPYRMRALVIANRKTSQPWVFRAIQFAVY